MDGKVQRAPDGKVGVEGRIDFKQMLSATKVSWMSIQWPNWAQIQSITWEYFSSGGYSCFFALMSQVQGSEYFGLTGHENRDQVPRVK